MKSLFSSLFILIYFLVQSQTLEFNHLNQLLDSLEAKKAVGMTIYISKDNKPLYQRAIGYANHETQKPHNIDSEFKIGSITKTYVATLALLLEEEGKLNLSDKLSKYYPDINGSDEITLEQMLRHRSGIFNYTDDENFIKLNSKEAQNEDIIKIFKDKPLQFKPGEQFQYSNSNYLLMGYIIENIEGKPLKYVLQEKIFEPYQLSYTKVFDDNPEFTTKSYMMKEEIPAWHSSWSAAAGSLTSTAQDVNRFLYLLMNDSILSVSSKNKMLEIQDKFGMGIMQAPFYEYNTYLHSGGIEGFHSITSYVPDQNINFTILINENEIPTISSNDIGIALLSDVYNKPYSIPNLQSKAKEDVSPEQMESWIGSYATPDFPLEITIFLEENTLMGQASGQGAFPLKCTNNEKQIYEFEMANIIMEFKEENGKKIMNFQQGGANFVFTRKE